MFPDLICWYFDKLAVVLRLSCDRSNNSYGQVYINALLGVNLGIGSDNDNVVVILVVVGAYRVVVQVCCIIVWDFMVLPWNKFNFTPVLLGVGGMLWM